MLRRLRELYRRHIAADVPIEMELCLDCGQLECSETRFAECLRRKARAAELAAQRVELSPPAADPRMTAHAAGTEEPLGAPRAQTQPANRAIEPT
jgi:hypothetical protein